MPSTTPDSDDRSGRARILDAAITRFGEGGVAATSLKAVAEEAGVSQPLIVHHFGSKEGLRSACDDHVAATVRAAKLDAMAEGPGLDPLAALRRNSQRPLLRYLARTLTDTSPRVAALLDEMVDDAVGYLAEGERTGMVKPSDDPRGRAVVLVLWSLGLLSLHEHLERLLGVDLLGDPSGFGPYVLPVLEILTNGVLAEGLHDHARTAFATPQEDLS